METSQVRAHLIISGRVQGVFYRTWTQNAARNLYLTGWVGNTEDGKVEAVFEGNEKNIKEMIENCKVGPKFAKVSEVKVVWEKVTGEFTGFEIV